MHKENLLVEKQYLLQKFTGKGAWTYALIPEIPAQKRFPFGWMKVSGLIDDYKLENYKLMPLGNGQLFLPVKAAIRKQIKKEAGDFVHIVLYEDKNSTLSPEIILECLRDAPLAYKRFNKLPEAEQKIFVDSIMKFSNEDKKIELLIKQIEKLNF